MPPFSSAKNAIPQLGTNADHPQEPHQTPTEIID
jgi:hypothetical protein